MKPDAYESTSTRWLKDGRGNLLLVGKGLLKALACKACAILVYTMTDRKRKDRVASEQPECLS